MSFRGDAHKLYLKLRSIHKKEKSLKHIKELDEIQEIRIFYKSLDTYTLKLIYYRMLKEKNGSGIVPIFVTAIPWFLFLFTQQLQDFLFQNGSSLWLIFSLVYILVLTISVIIHLREKAWAALHIQIIQDIIIERNRQNFSNM